MNEEEISKKAVKYINKNKELLIERFANSMDHVPEELPMTIFMAGSPGAGKTEFSKELAEFYNNTAVRIDADDIRNFFEDYDGLNAHVFQKAVSIGVDILYRFCLANNFNIILDGTFAHKRVSGNIQKSLDKNRRVFIAFIYQRPEVAWNFTENRELVDHRKITKDSFIRTFLQSR